jgi:predicted subunit of tRNA(5-methylaminomethyl-2-thiouridylate) methyltransferase
MMEIAKKAHQYLMESLGFSNRWINWTKNILESATTSILLNGVPGRNIHCKRGVRQGDPLSFLSWQQIYSNV